MSTTVPLEAHARTARAFADAYRDVDADALRTLLAPDAVARVLAPPGYSEYRGPEALAHELGEFFAAWEVQGTDEPVIDVLVPNRRQTGHLVRILQRYRLRSADDGALATMELTNLIAIREDGRIGLVDELCSGIMPTPG